MSKIEERAFVDIELTCFRFNPELLCDMNLENDFKWNHQGGS